jgi:hypothetical protein
MILAVLNAVWLCWYCFCSKSEFEHTRSQTTLDLYTQEDSDETRAAQGEFLNAVGMSGELKLWVELWVGVSGVTPVNSFRKNGGDDETRTRDLCRDRAMADWRVMQYQEDTTT